MTCHVALGGLLQLGHYKEAQKNIIENFIFCVYVCRYTAENSVKFGAPRDTDHPELRQPLAPEIWQSVVESLQPGSKVTILTNGPLTNVAKIVLSGKNSSSAIEVVD